MTIQSSTFSFNNVFSNCSTINGGGLFVIGKSGSYNQEKLVEILIIDTSFDSNGYISDDYSCNINGSGLYVDFDTKFVTLSFTINHSKFEFNKASI